jgi:antitoxin ParD1/3/4/toxin ParE1/3/4
MAIYVLSPAAESDVTEIAASIEEDNPIAARQLVEDFLDAFERLAKRPAMGHRRPDLTSRQVLFWPVRRSYLIVYRAAPSAIEIVRVFNARRDLASILAKLPD